MWVHRLAYIGAGHGQCMDGQVTNARESAGVGRAGAPLVCVYPCGFRGKIQEANRVKFLRSLRLHGTGGVVRTDSMVQETKTFQVVVLRS